MDDKSKIKQIFGIEPESNYEVVFKENTSTSVAIQFASIKVDNVLFAQALNGLVRYSDFTKKSEYFDAQSLLKEELLENEEDDDGNLVKYTLLEFLTKRLNELKSNWTLEESDKVLLPESEEEIYLRNLEFSVNSYEFYYKSGDSLCYFSFDAG